MKKQTNTEGKPLLSLIFEEFGIDTFTGMIKCMLYGAHKKYSPRDWKTRSVAYHQSKRLRHAGKSCANPWELDEETKVPHNEAATWHGHAIAWHINNKSKEQIERENAQYYKGEIERMFGESPTVVSDEPLSIGEWARESMWVYHQPSGKYERGAERCSSGKMLDLYTEYHCGFKGPVGDQSGSSIESTEVATSDIRRML